MNFFRNRRLDNIENTIDAEGARLSALVTALDCVDRRLTEDLEQLDHTAQTAHQHATTATADIHGLTEEMKADHDLLVSVNSAVDDVNAKVDLNVVRIEERLSALEARFVELEAIHDDNVRFIVRHLGLATDEAPKEQHSEPARRGRKRIRRAA